MGINLLYINLISTSRLRVSRTWSVWLVAMEVVNLLHVMFEIWIIDKFLNGYFLGLGPRVLNMAEWDRINDPLELVFPKVSRIKHRAYYLLRFSRVTHF